MRLDALAPEIVGGRTSLRRCLIEHYLVDGLLEGEAKAILDATPMRLISGEAFFDRLTHRWRYEYAPPLEVGGQILHGAVNCPEVRTLGRVLQFCISRLAESVRRRHLARLSEANRHLDSLAEFLPVVRLSDAVTVISDHRTGAGGCDVDWLLRDSSGRDVLIEVKARLGDLTQLAKSLQAATWRDGDVANSPQHDAAILFRSVQKKFLPASPASQLQGVWISTTLAQPPRSLSAAFDALAHDRVHFAILGDWNPGIFVLSRVDADRAFLLSLFGEHEGQGWLSKRGPASADEGDYSDSHS